MSGATKLNFEKRTEKVKFRFEKVGISDQKARVGALIDVSYSMKGMFAQGIVQETVERLLPVAGRLDDDGVLDMAIFDDEGTMLPGVRLADVEGYVEREIIRANVRKWNGTKYAGAMELMLDEWFGEAVRDTPRRASKKPGFFGRLFGATPEPEPVHAPAPTAADPARKMPALMLINTDGANGDQGITESLLQDAASKPVYFAFVGIGDPKDFGFIKRVADKFDNVGFISVADLTRVSDDQLYERIITDEFAGWLRNASAEWRRLAAA